MWGGRGSCDIEVRATYSSASDSRINTRSNKLTIRKIDRRDGTLIAGDAFQTRAGVAVSGTIRPLFPFPAMATWDRPSALTSARLLRSLDPTRLAVGHGEVLEQPVAAMDRAIAVAAHAVSERQTHGA